jgi:hypothetical protein
MLVNRWQWRHDRLCFFIGFVYCYKVKAGLILGDAMNNIQTRTAVIFAALAALMAATRFNHFGSAVSLPDASYAVFFLGGMYLAGTARLSVATFAALILEAGWIDYYATSVQGVSDWCMSPAYWFLIPTYAGLWMAGRWLVSRNAMSARKPAEISLVRLGLTAWAASTFAFVFSNATFYLFSGRYAEMSAAEYTARVAQYYVSYVSMAMLYIACAVAVHVAVDIIGRQRAQTH